MSASVIRQLRMIGWFEGVSFLVLLGIAMPLKYLAGMPMAVRIVGMAHGVLFILYAAAVAHAVLTCRWGIGRAVTLMLASVLPFGTFVVDGRLRREEVEAAAARAPAA